MGFFMRKAQPYSISFHARSASFASVRLRVPKSHCKHQPHTNGAGFNRLSLSPYL